MPKPSIEMNKNNNHTTNLYTKKPKEQVFITQPIKGEENNKTYQAPQIQSPIQKPWNPKLRKP